MIRDFANVLRQADVWITYNGKRFDVPYIQAKLLFYNLPPLPNTPHIDLYWTVRGNMAISRKNLDTVSKVLKLDNEKTPVAGEKWRRAMCGELSAIRYVIRHCRADVLILEEAYLHLRPLIRMHPRIFPMKPCYVCGSERVKFYPRITTAKSKMMFLCSSCGFTNAAT